MRISDWSSDVCSADLTGKLIDFGIARLADSGVQAPGAESASRSSLQNLSLTPGYAAPERMTGSEATTAADIYSLGRLLEKVIIPDAGDAELRAIIDRATAEEPDTRYAPCDAPRADRRAGGAPLG